MGFLWSIWLCLDPRVRLFFYNKLIVLGRMMYPTKEPSCFRIPFGMYAKIGDKVHRSEAVAMSYLAMNTTIPVPHVLDILDTPTGLLIIMTRLPGQPIWGGLKRMSKDQLENLYLVLPRSGPINSVDGTETSPRPGPALKICSPNEHIRRYTRSNTSYDVLNPPASPLVIPLMSRMPYEASRNFQKFCA